MGSFFMVVSVLLQQQETGEACGVVLCGCCPLLTKVALYMVFFLK